MSDNERAPFLSAENLKRLGATIESFIYNTYQIQLKDILGFQEFQQVLRDVMVLVDTNGKNFSFIEKNKQVIVQVRNILFENINKRNNFSKEVETAPVPEQEIETRPNMRSIMDPVASASGTGAVSTVNPFENTIMPVPIDRVGTQIEQSEDVFFKKLDELEQKRKAPAPGTVVHPPSSPLAPISSISSPNQPSYIPSSSPSFQNSSQSMEHVIVAMPPPPRKGTAFIISSWDRYIVDNPERSILRWNTPLPPLSDQIGTRIAGIFLPISLSTYTPYVHILLDGPGGNQTSFILAPDTVLGNKTRGWQRWSPLDVSLSYIKNISSPWIIYLKSADGTILPLGLDHLHIVSIAVDITNRSATLKLGTSIPSQEVILNEGDFQVGDQIWIFIKTEKKKTEVLSVSKDSIQIRYNIPTHTPSMSNAVHEWMNARILNYNRQWSMILDITNSADSSSTNKNK